MKFFILIFATLCFSFNVFADSEKTPKGKYAGFDFHWDNAKKKGVCMNKARRRGLNPHFLGPCGDLRGLDLSDYDLSGKDLSGSYLDGINFESANFNGTKLISVQARGTDFTKAKMNGADLSYAVLSGAKLDRAQLNGAKFFNANLSGTKVRNSELSGTSFQKANLRGTLMESELKTIVVSGASYTVGTHFNESVTANHKKAMVNASSNAMAAANESETDDLDDDRSPASK